jgi:hypothetical protein
MFADNIAVLVLGLFMTVSPAEKYERLEFLPDW